MPETSPVKNFDALFDSLMANTERMVSTKRVIGEPFQVGNVTLIPIMTATVGVGAGTAGKTEGSDGRSQGEGAGGGGLGMRLSPTALAAVIDGELRVYSLGSRGALEKLLETVPELIQKVTEKVHKPTEAKEPGGA